MQDVGAGGGAGEVGVRGDVGAAFEEGFYVAHAQEGGGGGGEQDDGIRAAGGFFVPAGEGAGGGAAGGGFARFHEEFGVLAHVGEILGSLRLASCGSARRTGKGEGGGEVQ